MAKNEHHTRNEPTRTPPPGMRPVTPIDLEAGIASAFERDPALTAEGLEIGGHTITRIATEVIPAHRIVQLLPDNAHVALARPTKADRLAVAVDNDAEPGDAVTVCVSGTEEIEAGETIARGQPIAAGQDGRAVGARGEPGSTIDIVGIALADAAPGDRVSTLLSPGRLYP